MEKVGIERSQESDHFLVFCNKHERNKFRVRSISDIPSIFMSPLDGPRDTDDDVCCWNDTDLCPKLRNVLRVGMLYAEAPPASRRAAVAVDVTFIFTVQ